MNEALVKGKGKSAGRSNASQKKYMAQFRQFNVLLHPVRDSELILWLDMQPNKQKAVRELIRKAVAEAVQGRGTGSS